MEIRSIKAPTFGCGFIIRSIYRRNQLKMKISVLAVFLAVLVAIASAGGNGYNDGRYNSRGYGKMRSYNPHNKWDSSNQRYGSTRKSYGGQRSQY